MHNFSPQSTSVKEVSACPFDIYERASRAGELSQASDAYSVGVLLLELITGLPAADGGRAPGHHLLAQALGPRLGDVAALQVGAFRIVLDFRQ